LSALLPIWYAEKPETGKPREACSSAGAMASANDMVPHRSSAVHQASGAAGTTVRASPGGIWPPWRVMK
jgi:hypothetical protein